MLLVTTPATPANAAAACSELGSGHLVTILRDGGLAELVLSMAEGSSVWVGASHDELAESRLSGWHWVDESEGADQLMNCGETGCGAWATGQPRQVWAYWCVVYVCVCGVCVLGLWVGGASDRGVGPTRRGALV